MTWILYGAPLKYLGLVLMAMSPVILIPGVLFWRTRARRIRKRLREDYGVECCVSLRQGTMNRQENEGAAVKS